MPSRQISESRVIAAPAESIFELIADPSQHPRIDGSGSVLAARGDKRRLALGMTFGMDMKIGANYKIRNTVVEFEEGRRIAWRHFNGHRWRWRVDPIDARTARVTETFDWSTARHPWLLDVSWFPRTNRRAITRSLDLLEEIAPTL